MSITHGSSQLLTRTNATGEHSGRSCGRPFWTFLFFPTRYLHGGGGSFRAFFEGCPRWCRRLQRACTSPPAEGERAAHQLPVAPDRDIFSDLVVGPPERVLHLFVAPYHFPCRPSVRV